MAKATCHTVVETKTTKTFTLILTEGEASALRALTGKVSGSAEHSIRGYIEQIFYALGSAGVTTNPEYSKSLGDCPFYAQSLVGLDISSDIR